MFRVFPFNFEIRFSPTLILWFSTLQQKAENVSTPPVRLFAYFFLFPVNKRTTVGGRD